jgi:hypothetical protein
MYQVRATSRTNAANAFRRYFFAFPFFGGFPSVGDEEVDCDDVEKSRRTLG